MKLCFLAYSQKYNNIQDAGKWYPMSFGNFCLEFYPAIYSKSLWEEQKGKKKTNSKRRIIIKVKKERGKYPSQNSESAISEIILPRDSNSNV